VIPLSRIIEQTPTLRKVFHWLIEEIITVVLGLGLTLRMILDHSGITHLLRKFIVLEGDEKKYPTGPLWVIGIYFAIYQVAVVNYQGSVAHLNRKVDQISTGVDQGDHMYWLKLLPKVQRTPTFKKPNIWDPFSTIESILGAEAPNPEIIQALKEVVESLGSNGKLKGADLFQANLEGAYLFGAKNLSCEQVMSVKVLNKKTRFPDYLEVKIIGKNEWTCERVG